MNSWDTYWSIFRFFLPRVAVCVFGFNLLIVIPVFLFVGVEAALIATGFCMAVSALGIGYRYRHRRKTLRGTMRAVVGITFLGVTTATPAQAATKVDEANKAVGELAALLSCPQECEDGGEDCPEGCSLAMKISATQDDTDLWVGMIGPPGWRYLITIIRPAESG